MPVPRVVVQGFEVAVRTLEAPVYVDRMIQADVPWHTHQVGNQQYAERRY
jgi:hypothetical protein